MTPSPEQEFRRLPEAFAFNLFHGPSPDPTHMEYILDRVEPELRGRLLANALTTVAAVRQGPCQRRRGSRSDHLR
jgi:hypothetical protein